MAFRPAEANDLEIRRGVFVPFVRYKNRDIQRTVNVQGCIEWISECKRFVKVSYSYCGHSYLDYFAVKDVKIWIDGRKKATNAVRQMECRT